MKEKKYYSIPIVFILLLMTMFVILAVLIISFGARIYKEAANNADINFDKRATVSYLTTKLRQNDSLSSVEVLTYDNKSVLALHSFIENEKYTTYLYEYNNYLYEYFSHSDLDFEFQNGTPIVAASNLFFEIKDSIIHFSFTDSYDNLHEINVKLRAKE